MKAEEQQRVQTRVTSISRTSRESEMFWLKSITAVALWSNESGRVSCLCIALISWHWRTKTVF